MKEKGQGQGKTEKKKEKGKQKTENKKDGKTPHQSTYTATTQCEKFKLFPPLTSLLL
jgi:hypothetical protein